jgi:hypothetical protein
VPLPGEQVSKTIVSSRFAANSTGYARQVAHDRTPDEPIDWEVPTADAAEQRREIIETPPLSENVEPTQFATEPLPEDADPADWQEQQTTVDDEDWDIDTDR